MARMRYRLALDWGTTWLGWSMLRLDERNAPIAIVRAGVRIFPDGRNPKDGSSLAETRRAARSDRRRRDRLLKRKTRLLQSLISLGFFPADEAARKALERLNPYELRAKGLNEPLKPEEFARALFHLNQRRGLLTNRKTDQADSDSSAIKQAVHSLRLALDPDGTDGKARTVGEWLYRRLTDVSQPPAQRTVRARHRERSWTDEDGRTRVEKSYDLYVDRGMVLAEFEALWAVQTRFNPSLFTEAARQELLSRISHQRPLHPIRPGRCLLLPSEERAPLILPSQQRFRIYREANNLRVLHDDLTERPLSLEQRDALVQALELGSKRFKRVIPGLLGLPDETRFSAEDTDLTELKGNLASRVLAKKTHFGPAWHGFDLAKQDAIVSRLLTEQSHEALVKWLGDEAGIEETRAEAIAELKLPDGSGNLSAKALSKVLPEMARGVVSFPEAARAAGFLHSRLGDNVDVPARTQLTELTDPNTGEIRQSHAFPELPYYGEFLQRHVGFVDPRAGPEDPPEKRFGRVSNPTAHIGLNQVRLVVNTLIRRYGPPSEVVVEVARELKQTPAQRVEDYQRRLHNQRRDARLRAEAADILGCALEGVSYADLRKLQLWEELSRDPSGRCCPYSGMPLSAAQVLSDEVEVDYILPFSRTLDDSQNNRTVVLRRAKRVKGNRTPWEAREDFSAMGWLYEDILKRAERVPRLRRYRFTEQGFEKWLDGVGNHAAAGFVVRALRDTRYMGRVARDYLQLICPQATWVIPGHLTTVLRKNLKLDGILGHKGNRNRDDHRHHAVDACVIGIIDREFLQRLADVSVGSWKLQFDQMAEEVLMPWLSFRQHVLRAVTAINVSHKPDHGYEGSLFQHKAYGIGPDGSITQRNRSDGTSGRVIRYVVPITEPSQLTRHGVHQNGDPRPYKGYMPHSNYCVDIVRNDWGKWQGEVIPTFEVYALVRRHGNEVLRNRSISLSGNPLIMRLMIQDCVRMELDGRPRLMRVTSINATGRVSLAEHMEANVDARNRDENDPWCYTYKHPSALQLARARRVTVSPIGDLHDPGFTN